MSAGGRMEICHCRVTAWIAAIASAGCPSRDCSPIPRLPSSCASSDILEFALLLVFSDHSFGLIVTRPSLSVMSNWVRSSLVKDFSPQVGCRVRLDGDFVCHDRNLLG